MSPRRDELLRATDEAAHLIQRFAPGDRQSFDVIGAVTHLEVPLIFRPLNGLWGAVVTVDGVAKGILVTTKLPLPLQRFTIAHELGHVLLGHSISFDSDLSFPGRGVRRSRSTQEIAADTFASELLAHRSLMLPAAQRHQWTRAALSDPANVYQLALRLGLSYQATCWSLGSQNVLAIGVIEELENKTVRDLKLSLVSPAILTDSWADVWSLKEADAGTYLEAGPNDIFVADLKELTSAGYLWQLIDSGSESEIIDEGSIQDELFGSATQRRIALRFRAPGIHRLTFNHWRPWNRQRLSHIDIGVDNHGKEQGGLARRVRESALARAIG